MKAAIPFLIICLCVGVYFLYISPIETEIKSLIIKRDQYYDVLTKSKEIKDRRDAILKQYDSISSGDCTKLDKIIPPKWSPMIFINDINGIAGKDGVIVKDFRAGAEQTADRGTAAAELYKTNTASFTVIAPYGQFKKFLTDMESSLSLMDITGLSVKGQSPDKPAVDLFNYALEIDTYSLK